MEQTPSVMTGSIHELSSLFKTCLDILRNDAEHLIGDEALNELSYFLILKQSEKHIVSGSIDILNLDLYKDCSSFKSYGKEEFQKRLELVKFSELVKYVENPEKEKNIKKIFDDFLWKEVLSKHPKFKDIFEDGKRSFIKESSTIKNIVLALSSINFNNYEYDILGEAYEKIFVDAIFGAGGNKKSELGQFFTPPKVKKLLLKLVDPKLKANGEIESVLDPASGTGGILNTTIKHFKQFVKSSKITDQDLRGQLIKNIYGIEIKGKIFNLCLSNMLINTGEILPNVICADSIRKFHNIKVDNIVANPPFSVTIKYDELLESLKFPSEQLSLDDYIPIKTGGKNSEMLFLQMMIHCLNINGRCATVMLDGQKMYGSASGYDKVREYLMRSCDLHKVILCPGGTFTTTASKTCILFFTKKMERKDVLKLEGTKRKVTFENVHSTSKVAFYDYNPDTGDADHLITEVTIDKIAAKNYSLNYSEYSIKDKETKEVQGIECKELGEVCNFLPKSKRPASYGNSEGKYPFFKSSIKINSYVDEPDYKEESLIIGDGGEANINYGINFSTSDHCYILQNKNKLLFNLKYIYYYLFHNLYIMNLLYTGAAIKNISKTNIAKIKIPIPSLEKQNKIVEVLDNLFTEKYNLQSVTNYYENYNLFRLLLDEKYYIFHKLVEWQDQSRELTKQIEFFKNRQERYLYLIGKNNINFKLLEELFDIKAGKFNSKDCKTTGKYPFYTSKVNNPEGFIDEFCFDYEKYLILIKDGGAGEGKYGDSIGLGKVFKVSGKSSATSHQLALIPKNNENFEYLYLYLQYIKNEIMDMARYTIGLGCIRKSELAKIKIPIPSLEKQKEIVAYCDYNCNLIKQLENEIENNKELAEQFIKGIVKNVGVDTDVDELEVEDEE
jgi:type I restriction-modification system DNA methylase subunit